MKTTKNRLALMVSLQENGDRYDSFGHVNCNIVKIEDGKVRNVRAEYDDKYSYFYLRVSSQMNKSDDLDKSYGWSVEYHNAGYIDLKEAKRMVNTLDKVEKHFNKLYQKYGNPTTFGQYCARLADALNIDLAVWSTKDTRNFSSYDDVEWSFRDINNMINHIDNLVNEWHKSHNSNLENVA